MIDLENIITGASAVIREPFGHSWYSESDLDGIDLTENEKTFIATCNPSTVLEMAREIESQKAERERCAVICEKYTGLGGVIAAAIRKGETK